ncbi:MAG: 16S rRNA (guanine(527)-N(7))-methyltransferase RsmG [Clostridiales bacterium]|nr:16S rRNA (guanine(527)-N(7))-methyltransferase RsmG [Clostridiales bacterium]
MKEIFTKHGILVTDEQLQKFEKYYDLLVVYNEKFNITTITDKKEVYLKHFIDSVLGVDKICGKTLIDIGSGGGFPAIPIKIMKDDLSVTLLEATGKKCSFLQAVIDGLNLKNIRVINDRAETLAKNENYREQFDICTARAVARLNTLCEYCMPFVKVGGKFVSYKANAAEEVLESKNAVNILGGKISEVYEYTLDDANRTLITIDKIKSTDKKYPRGNGKERKNPL